MSERGLARLSQEKLAAERERAIKLRDARSSEGSQPEVGEIWSIRGEILDLATGQALEHSWSPVMVGVWHHIGPAIQVIPISFDLDYAGRADVVSDEPLFQRRYMIECWLRMPVLKSALGRRLGAVAPQTWKHVERECADDPATRELETADDAQLAYRQSERLRVLFAAAGATARLAGTEPFVDTESHEQKRLFAEQQARLINEARDLQRFHPAPAPKNPTAPIPV